MRNFDFNVRGLGLLLTPTFMRRPVFAAILYALLSPLTYILFRLRNFRKESAYRMGHNGQVCYLRAVLNDQFDPLSRRITITEKPGYSEQSVIYERDVNTNDPVPMREHRTSEDQKTGGRIVTRRGYTGSGAYDFWVNIPSEYSSVHDRNRIEAVVNTYKLVSKRFEINYI